MKDIDYGKICIANKQIKTTDIKGKDYAQVNERIKAFRMLYPTGQISTEIISLENGVVTMKASVFDKDGKLLGTGMAQEKENSTFINKTSYIENCETSAVGRALGMCGFGIDVSIESAEELTNALENQKKEEQEMEELIVKYTELRSDLEQLGCDFREEKTNKWICSKAKIETQDLNLLGLDELRKLCKVYTEMIDKKKNDKTTKK